MSEHNGNPIARRVLLVDDDIEVLQVVSASLRARGYRVHVADGVDQASVFLDTLRFDAVITDLNMPPQGPNAGLEVARLASLMHPTSCPLVILWTGSPHLPLDQLRPYGVDDVLLKGSVPALAAVLARRLASRDSVAAGRGA